MGRVYNFSAGPACLPEAVLKKASEQMLDYEGSGMSVMEMSHRSKDFQQIIDDAEANLRKLMNIPDNYKVLFLQGGGTQLKPLLLHIVQKPIGHIGSGEHHQFAGRVLQRLGLAETLLGQLLIKSVLYPFKGF